MKRTIELKAYPFVHRHIHGLIKNKIKQGSFFNITLLRWCVRKTMYHVPEQGRWDTVREMEELGMIKRISRDKFEWVWIRLPIKKEHRPKDMDGNFLYM